MGERMVRTTWRARWAAVGAAVAITLGGSGIAGLVDAATGTESSFVPVTPTRVLDSRDAFDLGLSGPFVSGVRQKLQLTGSIPTISGTDIVNATVVPAGATGVSLNLTVFQPSSGGFISIRPGTANDDPTTASHNFNAGDITPNAVNVALPTAGANAGQIDIWYQGVSATQRTDIIIDVVGYYTAATGGGNGTPGPKGDKGDQGEAGPKGDAGAPGVDPANVVWVAKSGGDFTDVQAAIDSITDASAANPYVINVAPGTYSGKILAKPYIDIAGSGTDITVLTSNGGPSATAAEGVARSRQATVLIDRLGPIEVRNLTITSVTSTAGHDAVGVEVRQQEATIVLDNVRIGVNAPGLAYGAVISNNDLIRDSQVSAIGGTEFTRGILTITGGQIARIKSTSVEATGTGGEIAAILNAAGRVEVIDSEAIAFGPDAVGVSVAAGAQHLAYVVDANVYGDGLAAEIGTDARLHAIDSYFFSGVVSPVVSLEASTQISTLTDSILGGAVTGVARCIDSRDAGRNLVGSDCGPAPTPVTVRWAKVDADGPSAPTNDNDTRVLASSGNVTASRFGTGSYIVTFDESIENCAWTATLNDNGAGAVGTGQIGVEQNNPGDPNSLRVRTWNSTGTPTDRGTDDGFTVTVTCGG